MATKTLNTRIQNRFDTLANWKVEGVELLKGEIALVSVTTQQTDTAGNVVNVPAVLMKVGELDADGNPKAFKDLPWLSAKAADVYDWAKKQYAKDIPVTVITGQAADGKDIEETSTLGTWLANLASEANTNTQALSAVEAKLAGIDDTVVKAITAAVEALDSVDNLDEVPESAGRFVRAVTQADGKVTITYANITAEDIPEISATKVIVTPASGTEGDENYTAAVTVADKFEAVAAEIGDLRTSISGGVHFIGLVNEAEEDLADNEIYLDKDKADLTKTYKANIGDVIIKGTQEYIWNGTKWEPLGDVSRLGAVETKISGLQADDRTANEFVTHVSYDSVTGEYVVNTDRPTAKDVVYAETAENGITTVSDKIGAIEAVIAEKAEAEHTHDEYDNQDAFSNIKVGATTITATEVTDTVEFEGSNVTITANDKKVTFTVADATEDIKGIVTLGKEGGAATYAAVDGLTQQVAAVESDYMRIGTDNNLYAGSEGTDVIIFNCGDASSWIIKVE